MLGSYYKAVCKEHGRAQGVNCAFFLKVGIATDAREVYLALHAWLCLGYQQGMAMGDHIAFGKRARAWLEQHWLREKAVAVAAALPKTLGQAAQLRG